MAGWLSLIVSLANLVVMLLFVLPRLDYLSPHTDPSKNGEEEP